LIGVVLLSLLPPADLSTRPGQSRSLPSTRRPSDNPATPSSPMRSRARTGYQCEWNRPSAAKTLGFRANAVAGRGDRSAPVYKRDRMGSGISLQFGDHSIWLSKRATVDRIGLLQFDPRVPDLSLIHGRRSNARATGTRPPRAYALDLARGRGKLSTSSASTYDRSAP